MTQQATITSQRDTSWRQILDHDLSIMLKAAGYGQSSQDLALSHCFKHVAPFLGPTITGSQPRAWRSFMTDDFTPLEYSWAWESQPKIRFSFEPVSDMAGNAADPFNRSRPLECVHSLRNALVDSDWNLFDLLVEAFYEPNKTLSQTKLNFVSSSSAIFLGLEFNRSGHITAKAYLAPVRAEQTGQTRLSVLSNAIKGIEAHGFPVPAYVMLEKYIRTREPTVSFQIVLIAIDCVKPLLSRLKIYVRSSTTNFTAVCSTLSLDGADTSWTSSVLAELRELWYLVLDLDKTHPSDSELRHCNHETAGILYCFDVATSNALPNAKIYIPVKHYGKSDAKVLNALTKFCKRHDKVQDAEAFITAVERLSFYKAIEKSSGFFTYISCGVKDGKLSLTSYISPQLHHSDRWAESV